MIAVSISTEDLQLLRIILATVTSAIAAALVTHWRAAKGNNQASRYRAELKLEQDEFSRAWRGAVEALRSDLDGGMRHVEEIVRHVPTSTDFATLEGDVRALAAKVEGFTEMQLGMRHTLHRIEDYLLKGKRP